MAEREVEKSGVKFTKTKNVNYLFSAGYIVKLKNLFDY